MVCYEHYGGKIRHFVGVAAHVQTGTKVLDENHVLIKCGHMNQYSHNGVFTKVSHYIQWIRQNSDVDNTKTTKYWTTK